MTVRIERVYIDRTGICSCGHSEYDHLGEIKGSFCVRCAYCPGMRKAVEVADTRRFRHGADKIHNSGRHHPLAKGITATLESGSTPKWADTSCDKCFIDSSVADMIPWDSYLLCPECYGEALKVLPEMRLGSRNA